jgi:cytochrome P450
MATELVPQAVVDEAEDARRRARFAGGAALEFADLVEHARTGTLARLAATEPLTWCPAMGGWLVTGRELAREVLGSAARFTVEAEPNLVRASLGRMMLTTDGPEQERGRRPFEEPFRLRPVRERFEAPVRARVEALVDALPAHGEVDLGTAFAAPFAIGVACDLLGLDTLDPARMRSLYEDFASAMVYDGDPEPQRRADVARATLNGLLGAEIAAAREHGGGSVTAAVALDPARGLEDDEIVAQLRVILFGAIETVESELLNTVLLLLEHPAELARVRADASLVPNALEEAMRLIPPVSFIERWTAEPLELGGVALGRGEFVGISVPAANRDPATFPDPERFDVARSNARHHLGFSHGAHHCLGFNLARLQGAMALAALLERYGALELDRGRSGPPDGFAFRKPVPLGVRLG